MATVATRPLVHIGYHKTATTWLQNTVFDAANGFNQLMSHDEIFRQVVRPRALEFDSETVGNLIAARSGQLGPGTADVISLETLSGSPFDGGRDCHDFAQRLKAAIPDARILITIREQTKIIASVYMQYLLRGGRQTATDFFGGSHIEAYYGFDAIHFEYDRLAVLYQSLFGAENVFVLPQEEIAADQSAAVMRISEFSGNETLRQWNVTSARGKSYSEKAVPVLRRINHFRRVPLNPQPVLNLGGAAWWAYRAVGGATMRAFPRSRPITKLASELFGDRFADSNRKLAALLTRPANLGGYQGIE